MRVDEIWRYPVKSLGGERIETALVGERGIEGDRAWGIFDPATGMVLTGRREPALLMLTARLIDGFPLITCDDGSELLGNAGLSRWMGRPVELRAATDGAGTFENPMDVENESDWVRWQSSGDTFHDGRSKVSLVSHDSLGVHDARRFRVNLILDGSGEDALSGGVGIGSTVLQIRKPIDRCIMVTRAQPGVPKNRGVLRQVIRERDNKLGIGAVVTRPGTISVSDELVV